VSAAGRHRYRSGLTSRDAEDEAPGWRREGGAGQSLFPVPPPSRAADSSWFLHVCHAFPRRAWARPPLTAPDSHSPPSGPRAGRLWSVPRPVQKRKNTPAKAIHRARTSSPRQVEPSTDWRQAPKQSASAFRADSGGSNAALCFARIRVARRTPTPRRQHLPISSIACWFAISPDARPVTHTHSVKSLPCLDELGLLWECRPWTSAF